MLLVGYLAMAVIVVVIIIVLNLPPTPVHSTVTVTETVTSAISPSGITTFSNSTQPIVAYASLFSNPVFLFTGIFFIILLMFTVLRGWGRRDY